MTKTISIVCFAALGAACTGTATPTDGAADARGDVIRNDTMPDVASDAPNTDGTSEAGDSMEADAFDAALDSAPSDGGDDVVGDAASDAPSDSGADAAMVCACDVTSLCDTGCACDIACSITPGSPPLGADAQMFERAEIAIYYPSMATGPIDTVTLRDDGYTGSGGTTAYRTMLAPASRPAITRRPVSFASDLDDDGREEVVLVKDDGVVVEDWSGTALLPRTVRTFAMADSYDGAAGDLDGDGGRDLVVSRQTGTNLTIEVLSVGVTGMATVRASTTLASINRHAITVARPRVGATAEIYVWAAATGTSGSVEHITARRFALSGSVLTEGPSVDLGGECLFEFMPNTHGGAIAVGNLDGDPESEIVQAYYCRAGDLYVNEYDAGLGFARSLIGTRPLDSTVADLASFRPFLAIGHLGATAAAAPLIALGSTVSSGGFGSTGPAANIWVIQPQSDRLSVYNSAQLTSSGSSVLTALAVRDTDRNGTDEIAAAYTGVDLVDIFGNACGSTTFGSCTVREASFVAEVHDRDFSSAPLELLNESASSQDGLGPGAVLAMGDFDGDTIRVRSTGNVYLHTGRPFVNAILAAPPTWIGRTGVRHTDASGTAFGTSTTTGTSDTRTINASASVTVSAGASFGVAEFSAGVTASFEYSSSSTTTHEVSYGTETSVGDDADLVLFRTIPYASYEYLVLSHPDPAQVGRFMTVDVPGHMIETVRSLTDFRAMYGAEADAVVPRNLLGHTIGDPTTYMAPGACTTAAIASRVGAGVITDAQRNPTLRDVGSLTSGGITQTMSISDQTGSATEIDLSVEMTVGVGAGGVSVEASAGVGTGWTHETTVGRDVTYTGQVGYLAEGYDASTRYEWGLCVFHFTDPQYGSYPVVDYVVQRF